MSPLEKLWVLSLVRGMMLSFVCCSKFRCLPRGEIFCFFAKQNTQTTKYFGMPAERDNADISDAGATAVVSPV